MYRQNLAGLKPAKVIEDMRVLGDAALDEATRGKLSAYSTRFSKVTGEGALRVFSGEYWALLHEGLAKPPGEALQAFLKGLVSATCGEGGASLARQCPL